MVWQCNSKFKDKTRCKTPHLTEDEVKAAFIRLVNKLSTDREFYITELYTEFDAGQWAALVDSMTVHAKDRITFTLTCGMEIEE